MILIYERGKSGVLFRPEVKVVQNWCQELKLRVPNPPNSGGRGGDH